jgi:hypothetical protein
MVTVPVKVIDGDIRIELGEAGQPGSVSLGGRPSAGGLLTIEGTVIPGQARGRGRGQEIPARFTGQLTGGRGMLAGRQGRQSCSLLLQLKP